MMESPSNEVTTKTTSTAPYDPGFADFTIVGPANPSAPYAHLEPIFDLLRDCGPNTKEIISKSVAIANQLNHQELRVSHLLLAMTLTHRGAECLGTKGLKESVVRRSCWDELGTIDPLPATTPSVVFSEDIRDVFREAQNISRRELDEKAQLIHLPQVVRAIVEAPLNSRFAALISGRPTVDVDVETYKVVADIRSRLDSVYVPHLNARVDQLSSRITLLSEVLEKQFAQLANGADRIEKRVRHIKHTGTILLGLFSIGLIAALFSMVR